MKIKITKRQKLLEVRNDKCHNFYYLVYGKIINEAIKKYKTFHFVVFFDAEEVEEYFDKDSYTKQDLSDYLDTCIEGMTNLINSFHDCKYFYEVCDQSIKRYNKINNSL